MGKDLKTLLSERKMSVTDLANKTGIPRTTIYNVTNGSVKMENMTLANVKKVAHAFSMTVDELIAEMSLFE